MNVKQIVFAVTVILNAVVVYSLIWGQQGVLAFRSLQDTSKKLEHRIRELDEENVTLSREIKLLQSDEKYVEKIIRKRLNFVRENEILYVFPSESDEASSGAGVNESKN